MTRRNGHPQIMSIYTDQLAVQSGAKWIYLTKTEMGVLLAIVKHRKRVSRRSDIKRSVWPMQKIGRDTIEQFVNRLRKKLGSKIVRTVHSRGYIIDESMKVTVYHI